MTISGYLKSSSSSSKTQTSSICEFDPSKGALDDLALLLAHLIVQIRCKHTKHLYAAWAAKVATKQPHANAKQTEALRAFLGQAFGVPGGRTVADDHVQSRVAEYLWYVLMAEQVHLEPAVYFDVPKFHATAPGADGFSVHDSNGLFTFKLWEIKKSLNRPSVTLGSAVQQLNVQALEYLAELTPIVCAANNPPSVQALGGQLVEKWQDQAQEAGYGVSIATSQTHVAAAKKVRSVFRSLDRISTVIPGLAGTSRIRGILVAVDNFKMFGEKVRDCIHEGM